MRQNAMWQSVVTELNQSLYGELMVCSMSTQLFHIPEAKDLKGNPEMHTHLVPASYHRVTATGSAQRLLNGEIAPSIVETLKDCIRNVIQLTGSDARQGQFQYDNPVRNQHYSYPVF